MTDHPAGAPANSPLPSIDFRKAAREAAAMQSSEATYAINELAGFGGVPEIGPAMAAELKPRNKLERAIAHQAGAAHALAMRFTGRANAWAKRAESDFRMGMTQQAQASNVEAARLANAAGRLMASVVEAALALDRLRNGARQTVTVRHMTVSQGGQAIVAGTVSGGGGRGHAAGGNSRK